jgi:uncharacterized membrane protein YkvA (DUF1232 family)
VPVFGYLDDPVIVPLGIMLAIKLAPGSLMTEFRTAAAERESRPVSKVGLVVVIAIWLLAAGWPLWFLASASLAHNS